MTTHSTYRDKVDDVNRKLDNIERHIDRLYLYLWIANRPGNPVELREEFDSLVNGFLERNGRSLVNIFNVEYGDGGEEVIEILKDRGDFMDNKRLEDISRLVETGEVLPLGKVRQYIGVFTGKMVKPVEDFKEDLNKFSKGDQVLVMNLEDYTKIHKGIDLLREDGRKSREEWEQYKKEHGWE